MKKRKISDAVVRRLPRYYRYLDDLHSKGIVRISSSSVSYTHLTLPTNREV